MLTQAFFTRNMVLFFVSDEIMHLSMSPNKYWHFSTSTVFVRKRLTHMSRGRMVSSSVSFRPFVTLFIMYLSLAGSKVGFGTRPFNILSLYTTFSMHALWILLHTSSCLDLSQISPEINRSELRPGYIFICALSNAVILNSVPVANHAFLSGTRLISRVIRSGVHRAVRTL
jgi:hypothetical protein